jgi:hypothetical protein
MKLLLSFFIACCLLGCAKENVPSLTSPNENIQVSVYLDQQQVPRYSVSYLGQMVLQESRLGIALADADFTQGLSLVQVSPQTQVNDSYELWAGKKSQVSYSANEQVFSFVNADQRKLDIVFRVSDDGVAFRYLLADTSSEVKQVTQERTTFALPEKSRAWLQPMSVAQTGWMNTNPSYEEHYQMEIPVGTASPTEAGWVFPALFNSGEHWLLITEAAMDGKFHASRLQQHSDKGEYKIGFPMAAEVYTDGVLLAQSTLPLASPWRIITVGSLATIMESTLGTDLAEPMITMNTDFIKPGISSWSWGLLKDDATVYDVQKQFIDHAADMNWPYTLVDADWDRKIGYDKIKELADYAATKNVGLLVWYNSSGAWNKTEYSPKSALLTRAQREQEFSRLQAMGVKGVKIDFFAGDGQSMMQYYNDILIDAAKYELLVNYHGSSLPRGLQRTYPHMMTMESVKGFEMITFGQESADLEASHATVLPFARNAFDPMDFTPTVFHEIPNIERKTTNGFQLALPIIFLSGIQHIVETPEGMATVPYFVKDFMRKVPARWDDVKFIDGYPGKLTVVARKAGDIWYVAGINGEATDKTLTLDLSFVGAKTGYQIEDDGLPRSFIKRAITATEAVSIRIKANGGFVMVFP